MKGLIAIPLLIQLSVFGQVSYFNQGFLRQGNAELDRLYLGIVGTNAILPFASETFSGPNGQGLAKLTNAAVGNGTMLWSNGTNWWYMKF